jgi:AcrR family transcriptional regulator
MDESERGSNRKDEARRIVDAAVAEAERVGWDNVRLRIVAGSLGIGLDRVLAHFDDLDAVADAWFARAWAQMLAPPDDEAAFFALPARQRVEIVLLRWFDALAPHREVTAQMLATKLWPFHPHHWAPMVFNLSRTLVWVRDAAALDAGGPRRAAEEIGLTWLFLATLAVWSRDDSPGQARTRAFLAARLDQAEWLMTAWPAS